MANAGATGMQLQVAQLETVFGGSGTDFGRCGPGSRWKWLGDVYTPECAAHDTVVRGAEARGTRHWLVHVEALPQLGPAVVSYFRARVFGH